MNKKGFTLIETILVLFFVFVLLVLSFVNYRNFTKTISLSNSANEVIATLQMASSRTLASKGDSVYGVYFKQNSYVLFKGSVYDELDPENEVYNFPSGVEYYSDLGINQSIVFDRITGEVGTPGNIILRLEDDISQTKLISVLGSGRIGLKGTVSPTGTRLTDSRHLHFNLGWSIQGATELTLNFFDPPNPDVQEIINMGDFFVSSTAFSWEGTIDVNGQEQIVKIHTHSLDDVNTELCIHRDDRYNTTDLGVLIDGNNIVYISEDGAPMVQASGGTMTTQ